MMINISYGYKKLLLSVFCLCGMVYATFCSAENSPDSNLTILVNPFRYSGYYSDTESGMNYCRARYYSPELMAFITRDSFDVYNRYGYCENDPVMFADPSGHLCGELLSFGPVDAGLAYRYYEHERSSQKAKVEPPVNPQQKKTADSSNLSELILNGIKYVRNDSGSFVPPNSSALPPAPLVLQPLQTSHNENGENFVHLRYILENADVELSHRKVVEQLTLLFGKSSKHIERYYELKNVIKITYAHTNVEIEYNNANNNVISINLLVFESDERYAYFRRNRNPFIENVCGFRCVLQTYLTQNANQQYVVNGVEYKLKPPPPVSE